MSRTLREELIARGVIVPAATQASRPETSDVLNQRGDVQKASASQLSPSAFSFFPLPQSSQGIRTQLFWLAKAAKQLSRQEDEELKLAWKKVCQEVVIFLSSQISFDALEKYKTACDEMYNLLLIENAYANPQIPQKLHELIKERRLEAARFLPKSPEKSRKGLGFVEKETPEIQRIQNKVESKKYENPPAPQRKALSIILRGEEILTTPAERNDTGIYLIMISGRVLCRLPIDMGGRGACNRLIRALLKCCNHPVELDRRPYLGQCVKYDLDEVCDFLKEIGEVDIPRLREYMGELPIRVKLDGTQQFLDDYSSGISKASFEKNDYIERRKEEWKDEFKGVTKFDWHGLK